MSKIVKTMTVLMITIIMLINPFSLNVAKAEITEIDRKLKEPKIYIKNTDLPEVMIGQEFELTLTLQNKSIYTAKEIKVTPRLKDSPFKSTELMTVKELISIVSNKENKVKFKFKVNENTKPGVYPLVFDFEFRNMYKIYYGADGSKNRTVYLKVVDAPNLPNVNLESFTVNPQQIRAGQLFDLNLQIKNNGEQLAKDVNVKLEGLSETNFSIYNDVNRRETKGLKGEEEKGFSYKLRAHEDMKTGGYKLNCKITYKDQFNRTYSKTEEIYISTLAKDAKEVKKDDKTKPKIIVSAYGSNPQNVKAGSDFNLSLSFMNTSSKKVIKNVKVSLESKETSEKVGSVFTPVNSSNTLFIESLDPKGVYKTNIPFNAIMDAIPKIYKMIVKFEYEDENGKQYTASEEIGIKVIQKSRLEAGDIKIKGQPTVNKASSIDLQYFNMGRTTIYNLIINITGENLKVDTPSFYVGNLASGKSNYYDTKITPLKEGELKGTITYTYENAAGEAQKLVKEFTINTENSADGDSISALGDSSSYDGGSFEVIDGSDEMFSNDKKTLWSNPTVYALAAAALLLVVIIVAKKRKKLKNKAFENALIEEIDLDE